MAQVISPAIHCLFNHRCIDVVFGDRLVFPAPKPSNYSMDQVSFSVSIGTIVRFSCMHLGERRIKPSRPLSLVMGTEKI